tara:strand:+ start:2110 stop:2364 length:255 start_codon:yes stop_codon:yes gene_type:complete
MIKSKTWFVYLLRCCDETLYCGITTDIERRIFEHNNTPKGSRYTRSRRPVSLLGYKKFPDRSTATKEEARIKKMKRSEKLLLFS